MLRTILGLTCFLAWVSGSAAQYNYNNPKSSPTHPTAVPPSQRETRPNERPLQPIRILEGDPGCYAGEGYYPNPDDCSKFYRCVAQGYYRRYDFDCAPGTVYDPELTICNFPNQVRGCGGVVRRPGHVLVVVHRRPVSPLSPPRRTPAPPPPPSPPKKPESEAPGQPIWVIEQEIDGDSKKTFHYFPIVGGSSSSNGYEIQRDPNYYGGSRRRPSSALIPNLPNNVRITIHNDAEYEKK